MFLYLSHTFLTFLFLFFLLFSFYASVKHNNAFLFFSILSVVFLVLPAVFTVQCDWKVLIISLSLLRLSCLICFSSEKNLAFRTLIYIFYQRSLKALCVVQMSSCVFHCAWSGSGEIFQVIRDWDSFLVLRSRDDKLGCAYVNMRTWICLNWVLDKPQSNSWAGNTLGPRKFQ